MTITKALSRITKPMLAEIKNLYNPPVTIKLISDALCVALGVQPSWENAKRDVWGDARLNNDNNNNSSSSSSSNNNNNNTSW